MNLLYDEYPERVILGSRSYEIVTDFKDWLRFVDMLKDETLEKSLKDDLLLAMYLDDIPRQEQKNAHIPLINFFRMEDLAAEPDNLEKEEAYLGAEEDLRKRPLYDFSFDAACILCGFWQDYRIDLTESNMHWWKFRILLDGLSPETEFKQRVMYRNADIGRIKDPRERERILKIQRQIAIPQPQPDDDEIGGMFW